MVVEISVEDTHKNNNEIYNSLSKRGCTIARLKYVCVCVFQLEVR